MAQPVEAPEWLDNSFLANAIRSYKHDETIEVLSFELKSGFSGHFASTMFQSKIEFKSLKFRKAEPEKLNVVIKAIPSQGDNKLDMESTLPLFETEVKMYSKVLPNIQQLLDRNGLKNEIGPEYVHISQQFQQDIYFLLCF